MALTLDQQRAIAMASARARAAATSSGPQPSTLQTIAASPVGRFAHDAVVKPLEGAASLFANYAPVVGSKLAGQAVDSGISALEKPYGDALAAQRNRPGYEEARQQADAMASTSGAGGFTDQMIAPFAPAMAGTVGLFGGLNTSNAAADAQESAQAGYAKAHPVAATAGGVLGGLLAAPLSKAPGGAVSLLPRLPAMGPQDAGMAYVQRLMSSSPTASTPRALSNLNSAKPLTSAEVIGRPAEVALGALARREGATADAFGGQMAVRNAAAPQRILDDYAAASGIHPMAARGDIEGFVEANQKAAAPLYREAYKANPNIASPLLDRILETPAGKRALTDARVAMQNDMSLLGTPDAELMDQAREGGTAIPKRGVASGMKLKVYDYIKQSLDDQISAAYRAGNKNEGNIIKDLKNKMVGALDDADVTAAAGQNSLKPEGGLYKQARAKAGEYLGAKKNYDLAQQHILDDKFTAKDMGDYVAKLGPADRQAYAGGVANKLFNLQQANKLKAGAFSAPIVEQKLGSLIGQRQARDFIANMATEKRMADFAAKRSPGAGSPSAEYIAAMQDQDGASALVNHGLDLASTAVHRGPMAAVMHGVGKLTNSAVARYITAGMATPVRDEAGRLLMLNPADLANELSSSAASFAQRQPQLLSAHPKPLGLFGSTSSITNNQ